MINENLPSKFRTIGIALSYSNEPIFDNATFAHRDMDYAFIALFRDIKEHGWTIVVKMDATSQNPMQVYAYNSVEDIRLQPVTVSDATQQALYEAIYDVVENTWDAIHDSNTPRPRNEDEPADADTTGSTPDEDNQPD